MLKQFVSRNVQICSQYFVRYYSTSISIEVKQSFPNYLVKTLGFSDRNSLSVSTRFARYSGTKKVIDFNFADNANSVVNFFNQFGFDDAQIRTIVAREPRILCSNVDKTLIPKFNVLQKHGVSGSDLVQVISANPEMLLTQLESVLIPAIQALKQVLGSDRDALLFLKKFCRKSFGRIAKHLLPNVDLLRGIGIPVESIRKHLLQLSTTLVIQPEKLEAAMIKVEQKFGVSRDSPAVFLKCLRLQCSEKTVDAKMEKYKCFGWTESDIVALIRKNPSCFMISESAITKKLGFLINEVGLKPAYVTSNCNLLTCSLEKRVIPRHKILLVLKANHLIELNYTLPSAIWLSESEFVRKLVVPFKDVHQLYAEITGIRAEKLAEGHPRSIENVA